MSRTSLRHIRREIVENERAATLSVSPIRMSLFVAKMQRLSKTVKDMLDAAS